MIKDIKGKFIRKKVLYTICFILFSIIDFVRHTQQEVWWGPIVNCTGILMLIISLSAYKLEELMCRFSYIWSCISAVLLALCAVWPGEHIMGIYKWTVFTAMINIWLIGILAYGVVKKVFIERDIKIKWNITACLAIAMVIFMMLSPYRAVWPVWFLAVFGLFYLTKFESKDFMDLQEAMVDGIIIAFFILQIYAYGYRPFDVDRYVGAFSNSNMTALHYLVTYTAVLIKIHFLVMKEKAKKWRYLFWAGAAVILDFQILTMTRTAWAVSFVITVLFGVIVIKKIWKQSWNSVLVKGIGLTASMFIFFPVIFATVRWLPTVLHHPVWYEGEWREEKVHSFDPADSEKYTDFDEFMGDVLKRLKILGVINNPFVLKVQAEEWQRVPLEGPENLTLSLRMRRTIYKAYLDELNWTGHEKTEGHYVIVDMILGTDVFVWHPQNAWIHIIYYYGIPTGILCLALFGLILGKQIYGVVKGENRSYAFIPLFFSIIFLMYGLMEVVWIIGQLILTLFLFVQHPQFGEKNEMQQGDNDGRLADIEERI